MMETGFLCILSLTVLSGTFCVTADNERRFPKEETILQWSSSLEEKLTDFAKQVTNIDVIKERYSNVTDISLLRANGEDILRETVDDLNAMCDKKKRALQRLVNVAENATAEYIEDETLQLEDIPFLNVKEFDENGHRLEYNTHFMQPVNFTASGVHIPLEIYEGYPEILNGLKWSHALDEVFKENLKLDPTLRWQYFGSQRGFMRVYPAFKWPELKRLPDLFDVRRRSWYIQGSVSPKDMVILIDTSGSVHGQTFDMMKISVKSLLNTLRANDYVNVAWFNNEVNWVVPCLDTLIQATSQYKRILFDAIDRLQEGNLTSYSTALDFAFRAFINFDKQRKPWEGADCQKMIMFFSDGGTEWPEDILNKYKNDSATQGVRIFTFACGPHPIPTVILKEMACASKGYFNTITALGAIRTRVQDYVRILSRPLILSSDDNFFKWSNFYRDAGGLGMMTTITLPVSDPREDGKNQTLLGVMGIDVPISEMESLLHQKKLGPMGYGFAINPNGIVVFHPRLQLQITYIEEPPDIDILELEGQSTILENLRTSMVDGKTGIVSNIGRTVLVGSHYALAVNINYFYAPIKSSEFRLALAVPVNHTIIQVSNQDSKDGLRIVNPQGALLAPWKYCGGDEDDIVEEVSKKIAENHKSCKRDLMQQLLLDVRNTRKVWNLWEQNPHSYIYNSFVFTDGGLTLVYPASEANHYRSNKDPYKNVIYQRTSQKKGYVFSTVETSRNGTTVTSIAISSRVSVSKAEETAVAAVAGAEIDQNYVKKLFTESTNSSESKVHCGIDDLLVCYLVDDGGIIISSNQENVVTGSFLGQGDPQIMTELVNKSFFLFEVRYNFQAWCRRGEETTTAANRNFPSILPIFKHALSLLNPSWLLNIGHTFDTMKYALSSLLAWSFPISTEALTEFGWDPATYNDSHALKKNHGCVTKSTWYYLRGAKNYHGQFTCDDCTRQMEVTFLRKVNLLLVVTEKPCFCSEFIHPLNQLPEEDPGPDICDIQKPYRQKPDICYAHDEREDVSDCGNGASSSHEIPRSTAFLVLLLLWSVT